MKQLEKYTNEIYAMLRILSGFMFSLHGFQKIFGLLCGMQRAIGSLLWIGGVIEMIGGIRIMVGLQTRRGCLHLQRPDGVCLFPVPLEVLDGRSLLPGGDQG